MSNNVSLYYFISALPTKLLRILFSYHCTQTNENWVQTQVIYLFISPTLHRCWYEISYYVVYFPPLRIYVARKIVLTPSDICQDIIYVYRTTKLSVHVRKLVINGFLCNIHVLLFLSTAKINWWIVILFALLSAVDIWIVITILLPVHFIYWFWKIETVRFMNMAHECP